VHALKMAKIENGQKLREGVPKKNKGRHPKKIREGVQKK
jgi:hypothetical protein